MTAQRPPFVLTGPIVIADVEIGTELGPFIAAKVLEAIYAERRFSPKAMAYVRSLEFIADPREVATTTGSNTSFATMDDVTGVGLVTDERPGVGVAALMDELGISRAACTRKFRSKRWAGWKTDDGNWQMSEEDFAAIKEGRHGDHGTTIY
jgi:hypothetical protein